MTQILSIHPNPNQASFYFIFAQFFAVVDWQSTNSQASLWIYNSPGITEILVFFFRLLSKMFTF